MAKAFGCAAFSSAGFRVRWVHAYVERRKGSVSEDATVAIVQLEERVQFAQILASSKEINLGLGLTLIPAKQIRPKYGRSTVMFARRFPNVRSGSRTAHFFRHRSLTTPSANFSFIKVYTRQQLPQQVSATRHFQSCSIRRGSSFTNILADDNPPPVQVTSITEDGIQLADGLLLPSSCIFLEGKVFLWNAPQQLQSWSPEHFEVFDVVVPKPGVTLP